MNVGIIGAGNIGAALAKIWAKAGHNVVISGSHDPEKVRAAAEAAGPNARPGSPAEAAAFGEVVVLSVSWKAVEDALREAGPLDGKVILDVTNPLLPDMSGLEIGFTESSAERIARLAPNARVVKAFNHVFAAILQADNRHYGDCMPAGFYCGDDAAAKEKVMALIATAGFEPIDAGPLARARDMEALAMMGIRLGYAQGMGTQIAWAIVNR